MKYSTVSHTEIVQTLQVSAFTLYTKSIAGYRLIAKQQKICAVQKIGFCSSVLELVAPQRRMCLFGLGEAHPVVLSIEDGVVLADEHVSQDPQGPGGGGDVQTHEAAQTHGLSGLSDLFDWGEGEGESQKRGLLTCWKINQRNKHGRPDPPPPGRAEQNKAALVCFVMTPRSHSVVLLVWDLALCRPLLGNKRHTLRMYCSPVRLKGFPPTVKVMTGSDGTFSQLTMY